MFNLEEYRPHIEIIKLSINSLLYFDFTLSSIANDVFFILDNLYISTQKNSYLYCGLLYIQALLELGYNSKEHSFFQKTLDILKIKEDELFFKKIYNAQKIKLNKTQIRSMIRRWSSNKKNPMKINEIVEDIINKISNNDYGVYQYISYHDNDTFDVYELIINEADCLFHDIRRKKYFTIIR